MVTCVWRASAESFDAAGFIERWSEIKPEVVWKRGDASGIGKRSESSGFNVVVAEGPDLARTVALLQSAHWLQDSLREAERMGAVNLLDFAFMMPAEGPYPAMVLPVRALASLTELRTEICFSVYPCSPDDED